MRQLYWRLEAAPAGPKSPRYEAQMVDYLLATRAAQLFPSEQASARRAARECVTEQFSKLIPGASARDRSPNLG
jgi:hypothetical protein